MCLFTKFSITCIKKPLKGSNESGLSQQVVLKCRLYRVDFRRVVLTEQWSLKAGGLSIQVVSNTGLTVQVNPIHTILKHGDYYDFMDRYWCSS